MARTTQATAKKGSKAASKSKSASNGTSQSMEKPLLMVLFEDQLKDIYWAEKALTKALPKMAKQASSQELAEAITDHLAETEEQIQMVEQVFELIEKKAQAKKCEAMDGLIKEGEEIMKETEKGPQRDAGIIAAAQKVEHYEIASYGTLRTYAEILGMDDVAQILEQILEQEKGADVKLTEIALSAINIEAAEEVEQEGEEE
jgi:ferritin-like metal-binding protein YciE